MSEYFNVSEIFGEYVFSDSVMRSRLPKRLMRSFAKQWRTGLS